MGEECIGCSSEVHSGNYCLNHQQAVLNLKGYCDDVWVAEYGTISWDEYFTRFYGMREVGKRSSSKRNSK
jgi:hypothetical protein